MCSISYLEIIGFIVVHVESSEQFWFSSHSQTSHVGHSFYESVSGKLLHLDVVKLPEVTEPLDELRGDAARELKKQVSETILWLIYLNVRKKLPNMFYVVYKNKVYFITSVLLFLHILSFIEIH